MKFLKWTALPLSFAAALLLPACGQTAGEEPAAEHSEEEGEHADEEGEIDLTAEQIAAAGIQIVRPILSGAGSLTRPATIEGDPQATQVVSAAIGGRVVSLTRNLGQPVGRGQVLAVIESREAATLKAEIEAARARLSLAQSNLNREERLFAERVSPEQDVIAARTAATEARIALRLAEQQLAAAGAGGGGLNRIGVVSPIGGQVIARSVVLGQSVAADAELFRVANLSQVSVNLALSPEEASGVRSGSAIEVVSGSRRASGRVSFVSPVLDETTRLVSVIAVIDNRAGQWRVGEGVTATLELPSSGGASTVMVPADAVQTVEGRPTVFVRTDHGFKATSVTTGQPSGSQVAITSGLTGHEQIAGAGSFTLKAELGKGEAEHGH